MKDEPAPEKEAEPEADVKTMSSTEIATLTGKEKGHVHRDIKEQLLKGLYEIDNPKMDDVEIKGISVVLDNRGYVSEYYLDKEHTLTLITGYDVKMRHSINKRWIELEGLQSEKTAQIEPPTKHTKPLLIIPAPPFTIEIKSPSKSAQYLLRAILSNPYEF